MRIVRLVVINSKHKLMVPREGLEPPTLSLEVSCSIQLSYRGLVRVRELNPRFQLGRLA